VDSPSDGRSLYVYRLEPNDWLVSAVGQDNQRRGTDLRQALVVLSAGADPCEWWKIAVSELNSPII
jgi:hypothetical protein